jgi:hypothetical protein
LYNNLDYSFTIQYPDGTFLIPTTQPGGGSPALRKQLGFLKQFIESMNIIFMKPDTATCTSGIPGGLHAYILSESGRQYAFYLMEGKQVGPEFTLIVEK